MTVRLVFKTARTGEAEHVADRFEQVKANLAWFVEEQPNNRRLAVFDRFERDATDLLRVDPDNVWAASTGTSRTATSPGRPSPSARRRPACPCGPSARSRT
jgi:hypothetical protein